MGRSGPGDAEPAFAGRLGGCERDPCTDEGASMIEAVCVTVLLTVVSLVLVFLFERWK